MTTLELALSWAVLVQIGLLGLVFGGPWRLSVGAHTAASPLLGTLAGTSALGLLAACLSTDPARVLLLGAARFDALAFFVLTVMSLIAFAVHRFALSYLAGDPAHPVFLARMARTIAFVSAFVLSDHLAVTGVLWIGMSLGMHALLRHFEGRAAARRAAKKKFWFSRVGDVAFWTAVLLLVRGNVSLAPSTWTVDTFAGTAAGIAALLLVGTVLLKSAQFPFHSWLPETMEAPTPVSALMHAGVINAGAFLLLRLSPLLAASPVALDLALVAGGLTTALGCLVWWSQPDVKKSLAWSTVAQMGFLMVEIGLGLFHTALLHLLGHALYKAHAFLRSGTLPEARVEEVREEPLSGWLLPAGATLALAGLLAVVSHRVSGGPWDVEVAMVALWAAISLDIARRAPPSLVARVGTSGAALLAFAATHWLAHAWFGGWFTTAPTLVSRGPFAVVAAGLLVVLLGLVSLWLAAPRRWREHDAAFAFHVHALNGFYVGTHAGVAYEKLKTLFSPRGTVA